MIDGENAIIEVYWETRGYSVLRSSEGERAIPRTDLKDHLAWLETPTAGMVDGRLFDELGDRVFKVTGTKTYKTALGSKTVVVLESRADEVKADVPPESGGPKSDRHVRWINESYDSVIYHVKGKKWEELDNKSKKVKWNLEEIERTDEYVVVYNPVRKETWRLGTDKTEIKQGGEWKWIATGHWEK